MPSSISIAIVTRNRPLSLERTLISLRAQSSQPYEVVISDDSCSNDALMVQQLAHKYDCRYIDGPRKGLYSNRNSSIRACTGTHIRTMDDDHTFPDDHFSSIASYVESDPHSIYTIGEVYASPVIGHLQSEYILYPGELNPGGYAVFPSNIRSYHGISCGGTVYPRDVFDSGCWNSEHFRFGASYLEFGALLKFFGFTIKPILDTYLVHHVTPSDLRHPDTEIPSMMFAVLCYSFLYYPHWRNQLSTLYFLVKIRVKTLGGRSWPSYWNQARSAFIARRVEIKTSSLLAKPL